MMAILGDITFLYPNAFWLFVPYILCIFFCKPSKQGFYFSNIEMLRNATSYQNYIIQTLYALIFIAMVIALSNPIKKEEIKVDNSLGYEISLLYDVSGSMLENNKFIITKEILEDFIAKREKDRLSLTIFADFAYLASPLTYDKKSLIKLLNLIEIGVVGDRETALYEALYLSGNLFKDSKSKNKIAILLTDGIDTADSIPLEPAIERIKKYGIKVYAIGIGEKGDYNGEALHKIANETGGKFYEANTKEKINQIYEQIDKLEKSEIKTNSYERKTYLFQYPLDVAIGLLFILILIHRKQI
jgi:Ca-activated chloride channel homolog